MKISLDYDGTYNRDPDLWEQFIALAKQKGHEVICVTNRPWVPNKKIKDEPVPSCEMLAAGTEFKDAYAKKMGHNVHIWIDDMPGTISPSLELP